ncbi:MAG TPA: hypothetical protein IAA60_02900 [Candidatus Ornithomonoglobus intestinigallinarum]|uniref:Uncharacterized protein n=1 Tax=Candidatus Ornithomonoglobus intestinigallinarum TaxID=2840894 RepID=A0A9D1H379_9FIRM|nr:hypothetical protein [Candidatus Ornithomonoglobus intestinigallinarum]
MKAKRLLASALALSMAFGAMSALAVTANAAGTTATITAIKADGTQTPCTDLGSAISTAGNGGTVEIGEGVVAISPNAGYSTSASVTIKGQGIGKTTIKPANVNDYISPLQNSEKSSSEYYNAKHLLEITASSFKLEDLTLDGTGVTGQREEESFLGITVKKAIDFVPLRLTGPTSGAEITLNKVAIKRTTGDTKGCIQIGTSSGSNSANVTASGLYITCNNGESNYADIEVCKNSSLTITEQGGFNGVIASRSAGSVTIPKADGYYSASIGLLNTYTFYTTIPYLLNCYENNTDRIAEYVELINKLEDDDTKILEKMASDLENTSLQLYGMNCNEQRELAQEFVDAINAIESMEGVSVTVDTTSLEEKLQQADWHTWGDVVEGIKECSVCHATEQVAPEPEVTTSTATVGEGTEDYDNTFATGFVTTIPSGAEVTSIQWEVTSPANDNTTKKTQVFDDLNLSNIDSELKLGLIINGLNDETATATAIINPAEVAE